MATRTRSGSAVHTNGLGSVLCSARLPVEDVTLDGEAVCLLDDGRPDFHALRSRHACKDARLIAFDLLGLDGEDLRRAARAPHAIGEPVKRQRCALVLEQRRGRKRRGSVPACVRDGARRHRVQADRHAVQVRVVPGLEENQMSGLRQAVSSQRRADLDELVTGCAPKA
jgi:hypothetical protein